MSKKTKQEKHQERLEEKEKHDLEQAEQEAHLYDDEFVVAPKGMSRRRFLFTLGVTIFVVLAFVVPGAIMGSFGSANPGDRVYVTWTRPGQPEMSMTVRDFQTNKQSHSRLLSSFSRQNSSAADQEVAAYLLEDSLALEAGIVVTDRDLRNFLRDQLRFENAGQLRSLAQNFRMTVKQYEEEMRRWLRVRRYRNILTQGLQFADPTEVESQWKSKFREYKFAYVEAVAEDFDEEARAIVPNDEELQAWFDALPQFQKNSFMTERKMVAEFVVVKLDGTPGPATLLEKFPMKEGEDLELVAKNYWDLVSLTHFQKPAPEDLEEGEDPGDLTIPYEEVKDICAIEAPTYNAMYSWLQEMSRMVSDPEQEFDFATEAAAVGLTLQSDGVARTQEEWTELEEIGSVRLAGMLRFAPAGNLLSTVVANDGTFVIGRCASVEDAQIPEFADMREEVVDLWVETKRADVALLKLKEIYTSFLEDPENPPIIGGPDVENGAFDAALTLAGLTAVEREWRDRVQPPPGGIADASPIDLYLSRNEGPYVLVDGQVSEPGLEHTRERAFMVRMLGSRDPELVTMEPGYVRQIENTLVQKTATEFAAQAFGFEAYSEKYNLKLHPAEPAE